MPQANTGPNLTAVSEIKEISEGKQRPFLKRNKFQPKTNIS